MKVFRKPPQWYIFHPRHSSKEAFLSNLPSIEPYNAWVEHWCDILTSCWEQNGEISPLEMASPASESDIASIEAQLKHPIPSDLRRLFATFSRHIQFGWDWLNPLDLEEFHFPRFYGGIRLGLSLKALPGLQDCLLDTDTLNIQEKAWMEADYPDVLSLEAQAFPFLEVGNGDCLVIDLRDGHVKYLSHDDPDETGKVLGQDFHHFMGQWSALGCLGPEIWILEPFLDENGFNAQGTRSQMLRAKLGLRHAQGDSMHDK